LQAGGRRFDPGWLHCRKVLQIPRSLAYGDQGDDGSGSRPGCMRGALDLGSVAPLLRLAPERRLRVRLRVLLLANGRCAATGASRLAFVLTRASDPTMSWLLVSDSGRDPELRWGRRRDRSAPIPAISLRQPAWPLCARSGSGPPVRSETPGRRLARSLRWRSGDGRFERPAEPDEPAASFRLGTRAGGEILGEREVTDRREDDRSWSGGDEWV
jgi:hypothetical protein